MGVIETVEAAVEALQAAGIRAARGYPAAVLPALTGPVAAVTVEASDQKQTVLAVAIYGPQAQGGQVCEALAQQAAQVLGSQGASCQVAACQFDGESRLFSVKVTATWQLAVRNAVQIDGEALAYVTGFSAVQTRQVRQVTDEDTGETAISHGQNCWTLTIQELLPWAAGMEAEGTAAFTLQVVHDSFIERYPECYWCSIALEETAGGLLRKREACSWAERILET